MKRLIPIAAVALLATLLTGIVVATEEDALQAERVTLTIGTYYPNLLDVATTPT